MSVNVIHVSDQKSLDATITSYLNQGFVLSSRDDGGAFLQKTRPPLNAAVIIIGLIIPFVGWLFLILYLIMHAMRPAAEVLELKVKGV
jgi:hypothetical protein